MKRYLQTFAVILLFAGGCIFMSLNGKPHAYYLISIIFFIACGWYAGKTKFMQLPSKGSENTPKYQK
jgi:hypothetical protein